MGSVDSLVPNSRQETVWPEQSPEEKLQGLDMCLAAADVSITPCSLDVVHGEICRAHVGTGPLLRYPRVQDQPEGDDCDRESSPSAWRVMPDALIPQGDCDKLRELLQSGHGVDAMDFDKRTALVLAAG